MFERLKSLPLTIVLTVLIWMYAEAQFTATREGITLALTMASPTKDFAVRVYDPAESRFRATVPIHMTVQGAQSQVEKLYQQSLGTLVADDEFANLVYALAPKDLHPGSDASFDTLAVLNGLGYFKRNGLTVTQASPPRLRVEIERLATVTRPITLRTGPGSDVQVTSYVPSSADVTLPKKLLDEIGGPDYLTVVATPSRDISTIPRDTPITLTALLSVEYPGPNRNEVVSATPAEVSVTLRIPEHRHEIRILDTVPVDVSGPPGLLEKYAVEVEPSSVSVTVSGTPANIKLTGALQSIRAAFDLNPTDRPSESFQARALRFILPEGVQLVKGTTEIRFRLYDRRPAPATNAAPATAPSNH